MARRAVKGAGRTSSVEGEVDVRKAGLEDEDVRALLSAIGRVASIGRREMREFGDVIRPHEADARITERHLTALWQVFLHEPLTVGELAERLELEVTTASLVATELGRAGMIERERDPEDRRRVLLRVKPKLARFIAERRLAPMRRMMAALDARERAALIKALGLFADEIERGAS
jgi:DNA-binding MarR family transcriptional regulator